MCYSAMVESRFRSYVRETGAELDVEQFEDIFGMRSTDPGVRIPRAIERWFDDPKSPTEQRIRALIERRNTERVTALEQEIFAQRKRLADAERKLAEKPTKAAQESKRIAAAKVEKALRDLPLYKGTDPTRLDARIFPQHFAPVVIQDQRGRFVRLARYHCRQAGKPESIDRQYPGLYNARRDNIDRFWRQQFGVTHALMLVESFYENVERDGKNAVLHFVPRPAAPMLIACLYSVWSPPGGGKPLLSFAAVTDDPPPEVAAAGHDRMIVNLKQGNLGTWLTPEHRSDAELQAVLSDRQAPYYEHEVLAA